MGEGFGKEAPMVIFDYPLFLVGSDLTPVRQRISEFVNFLTKWVPQTKAKAIIVSEKPKVAGKDYVEALQNFHNLFLQKQWGDGLSVTMPTKERVDWILTGTDKGRDELISATGKISPKGGIFTYEVLSTALAMAGGRPEYLPVLIAYFNQNTGESTSSGSSCHGLVVNGPISRQIRMGFKFGNLGPDPNHPATGCIGRAIRFVFQNVGGCTPGLGNINPFGEGRHVGVIIAEDEENAPEKWDPFNTEYYATKKGTNTTTVITPASVRAFTQRGNGNEPTPEIEAEEGLRRCANTFKQVGYRATPPALVTASAFMLYPSSTCDVLNGIYGSKAKVKETIAKYCFAALDEYQDATEFLRLLTNNKKALSDMPARTPLATAPNIMLICAGGDHPSRAMCIPGSRGSKTVEIVQPKAWSDLLKQAETDLGPLPWE
jgi:hypothetical protein